LKRVAFFYARKQAVTWNVRHEKALAIQGFSDAKTAKAYCNTKTAKNGFLIFHANRERK